MNKPYMRFIEDSAAMIIVAVVIAGILLAAIVFLTRGCSSPSTSQAKQIIFITVDTLRYDRTNATHAFNLTQFFKEGVKYSRCYSPSPWTYPAFASMFTGIYPHHIGIEGYARPTLEYYSVPRVQVLTDDATTLAEKLSANGYTTRGITNSIWVSEKVGLHQGFDTFTQYANERCSETLCDAIEWLDERRDDEDFFLFLHFMDPHVPYKPPKPVTVEMAPNYNRKYKYEFPGEDVDGLRSGAIELADIEYKYIERLYDAEIKHMDARLNMLLEYIASNYPDALIIFTSDHGEEFWDHGGFEHGHTMYDELLHVPLYLLNSGMESEVIAETVSTIDIMPTVLDWAGVKYADGDLDGSSLYRYPNDSWVFHEATLYGDELKAVTHDGYRLIRNMGTGNEVTEILDTVGTSWVAEDMENALNAFISLGAPGSMKKYLLERIDAWTREELESIGYLGGPE